MKQIMIPKENAVFWMSKDGNWHNEHRRFGRPKIIRYFDSSIQKDNNGYFVCRQTDEFEEKVYFAYEDTALFVFDIKAGEPMRLVLSTGQTLLLASEQLIQIGDSLYIETADHRIKFTQNTLLKRSSHMKEENGLLWQVLNNQRWEIKPGSISTS